MYNIRIGNQEIDYTKIDNDVNGNPRYYIPYTTALALVGIKWTPTTKEIKIKYCKKYRGKKYGAGFVITSYNLQQDLERIKNKNK